MTVLVVLAKVPCAGRVKTRLCPPLSATQAATFAEAALHDTLDVADTVPWTQRVLAVDRPAALPPRRGWLVVAQGPGSLDVRIATALVAGQRAGHGAPVVLIGMDTPHVDPAHLAAAASALSTHDAVVGPAHDGGFWLLGLRQADPALTIGVPMSQPHTSTAQQARLRRAGLTVAVLPAYRDIDTFADAVLAAHAAPHGRFARALPTGAVT